MTQMKKINGLFHGILTLIVLTVSTTLVFIPFFVVSLLKIAPSASWRLFCTRILHRITTGWIDFNNFYIDRTKPANLKISGIETIQPANWHLVIANHQSWLDIVVLQYVLNRPVRIPLLSFFIKNSLKWIPLLGFAWWAMGYPFMKRHPKAYLEKKPHKKGEDLKSTLKAINRFKKIPASIVSFVEGTRFTDQKNLQQQVEYQHLLKPKAGGISFVIGAMHKEIDSLLDITIAYQDKQHSIWDFFCHRLDTIKVKIRQIPIPIQFRNPSLLEDASLQSEFRAWLNAQWHKKDQLIGAMKST